MRHITKTLAGALTAALLAGTAAAADWKQLESPHFRIYTDQDALIGREMLQQLEQLRWLGLRLLGANDRTPRLQTRFDTFVFRGRQTLKRVKPEIGETVAGMYVFCREGATAYALEDGHAGRHALSWGQQILQHEYAHHLMFQYANTAYPPWYVEGFAEYLSTVRQDGDRLIVGETNRNRAMSLNDTWLPLADVLGWHLRPAAKRPPSEVGAFYAQSWLLTHYMLSDESRARALPAYFERVGAGEDPVAAFEPATGIVLAELADRLRRYYRSGATMLELRGQEAARAVVKESPLGPDADAYVPEASALRGCVSPERAKAILTQLRALAPDPARASPDLRLALARAETLAGDAQAAITLLEPMATDDNAEAHYLLGRAWGRRAEALDGDAQREARDQERGQLLKAYRLRKDHAPTLYFLALALERNSGFNQNVLNAARAARLFAPAVPDYALLAVSLELQGGDRDRAALALGPLASNPHDTGAATRARLAVEAIRAGKSAAEVFKLMAPPKPAAP